MKRGKKVWFMLLVIPGLLILLYFCIVAFFSGLQKKLIYCPNYPTRDLVETPEEWGLRFDEVLFVASDRTELHGWYIPARDPRGTILFCHGNAGNISHRRESVEIFNRLQMNVFVFDYRGYGKSEGKVSEHGTYRDVEAAWKYLVESRAIVPSQIVIFGRSLGGAIAGWAAQDRDAKALIIESTFTSIPDIGADMFPFLPTRFLARYHYSTIDYLKNVRCPVLVIHSVDDEMIPFEHGRKLYDAASEPKQMMELRGTHNEIIYDQERRYENRLNAFISNLPP